MKNYPYSRQNDIVVQSVGDEILIYDLQNNKTFCLNESSALVWRLCDGTKPVSQIAAEFSRKFKTEINEEFVWLALDGLKREKLLFSEIDEENVFKGLSRREAIRKVGLASMVALPVVSALVAPTAAHAASACVPYQTLGCAATSLCCTGLTCRNSKCCVPNTTGSTPDGAFFSCGSSGVECQTLATLNCCSGVAATGADQSTCSAAGQVSCYCQPRP